jgi:hypothetical protein
MATDVQDKPAHVEKDPILQVLERHGITDAAQYLLTEGANPVLYTPENPDFHPRGNVLMMLGKWTNMKAVDERLSKLKHL